MPRIVVYSTTSRRFIRKWVPGPPKPPKPIEPPAAPRPLRQGDERHVNLRVAAAQVGVSTRTIRNWEKRGWLVFREHRGLSAMVRLGDVYELKRTRFRKWGGSGWPILNE